MPAPYLVYFSRVCRARVRSELSVRSYLLLFGTFRLFLLRNIARERRPPVSMWSWYVFLLWSRPGAPGALAYYRSILCRPPPEGHIAGAPGGDTEFFSKYVEMARGVLDFSIPLIYTSKVIEITGLPPDRRGPGGGLERMGFV